MEAILEMVNQVKLHIEDCMKGFVNNHQNRELMYARLDELFLLWSRLIKKNFVESVEEFGLTYKTFHEKNYEEISRQIINKFPEDLSYE